MPEISKKKVFYPINIAFREYLESYDREIKLPLSYEDLRYYDNTISLYDEKGIDTLWETVFYPQHLMSRIHSGLKRIYSILKAGGDNTAEEHLRSEEHTSELQSRFDLVCRLLLDKQNKTRTRQIQ